MATQKIRFLGNYDVNAQGKFLWEILAQLKSFGVGRMVTKNEWGRKWPDQPSYLIIRGVEPEMDRWLSRGKLWADWTYRGRNLGTYMFDKDLNRSDWRLIFKHEEEEFSKCAAPMRDVVFPDSMPLPPLQVYLAQKRAEKEGRAQSSVPTRVPIQLCVDPEFKMIEQFMKQEKQKREGTTIYEEADQESLLDLYGAELPTKVEAWSLGPAEFTPRWSSTETKMTEKMTDF